MKFLKPVYTLRQLYHRMRGGIARPAASHPQWTGRYATWEEAARNATGYDDDAILAKVRETALRVNGGEVAFERDSVPFDTIQYSWPVLAALERIALEQGRKMVVVDFGGALGSSYQQNKAFLTPLTALEWWIVEQENYVACGRAEFSNKQLHFAATLEEVAGKTKIDCVLLSGVLQVLPKPTELLQTIFRLNVPNIVVDRTAFIEGQPWLTVQHVPASIYAGSYAHWFFNEKSFRDLFTAQYQLVSDFETGIDPRAESPEGQALYWKGFHFCRHEAVGQDN